MVSLPFCREFILTDRFPVLSYTCDCNLGYSLNSNKLNCTPICGDGLVVPGEICDPASVGGLYGCFFNCTAQPGYTCTSSGCQAICGDGMIVPPETCDDGNSVSGDGCSSTCTIETGYACPTPGQLCVACQFAPWMPLAIRSNYLLFPAFRALGYNVSTFPYIACSLCRCVLTCVIISP